MFRLHAWPVGDAQSWLCTQTTKQEYIQKTSPRITALRFAFSMNSKIYYQVLLFLQHVNDWFKLNIKEIKIDRVMSVFYLFMSPYFFCSCDLKILSKFIHIMGWKSMREFLYAAHSFLVINWWVPGLRLSAWSVGVAIHNKTE